MGSGSSAHAQLSAEATAVLASKQASLTTCLDRLEKQERERQTLEAALRAAEEALPESTNSKDEVTALLADLASQTAANAKTQEQVQAALGALEVFSSSANKVRPCQEEEKSPERALESSVRTEAPRPSEDPVLLKEEIARLKVELAKKEEVIQLKEKLLQEVKEADAAAAKECGDIVKGAETGNAAAVRHFARTQPDSLKKVDAYGDGPLALAAYYGHLEAVQVLLDAGASVDAKDYSGEGPLALAAWNGHVEAVQVLLAAGAAVDAKNFKSQTALHRAAWMGHEEVVEKLLSVGAALVADEDGDTALHDAARNGHAAVVELLSAGAAVDAANQKGWTALHRAAEEGRVDVAKKLLAAGAALDAVTTKGEKPYDLAKNKGDREVMAILDRVWVTLLSGGRTCHCDPSQDRTISELKDEAESKLGVCITSLIGPDKPLLDFTQTLAEAEIRPGVTLTAGVAALE